MRRTTALRALGLTAAAALFTLPALAGGPLAVCECGTPYLWPNGGQNIPFNPDQGDLAILNNADATQFVIDSFQAWEDVTSSTASYFNAGQLPVDVDDTNFVPFLFPGVADGFSPIVFDDDGAIFDLLFGPSTGVLGFAGPDVVDSESCEIVEGAAFLNGPSFGDLALAANVMVHEFGHYTNLAHTVVNGQIFLSGEGSGPGADFGTFGVPPFLFGNEVVATMYPFLFIGGDQLSRTPHADDIAILSTLYPEPDFLSTTGTITGSILGPNSTSPITGVNVIARNLADPFTDAVSAISSDFTDDFSGCCPVVGTYTINNLTPGADYALFVDEIIAGGFSTPPASPLPGPEEFYNGASETGDSSDVVLDFTPITVAAGAPVSGIDVLFNGPDPGDPLPVGDDGSVQLFLPFNFCFTGQPYDSVFVNANGNLTFGAGDTDFTESAGEMLDGPPRIAGVWDDLQPFDIFGAPQGTVTYSQTASSVTVSYIDVPEWGFFGGVGANSFDITLNDNSDECKLVCPDDGDSDSGSDSDSDSDSGSDSDSDSDSDVELPDVTITYGALNVPGDDGSLAGASAGLFATNGVEPQVDLTSFGLTTIELEEEAAAYEVFDGANVIDLSGTTQNYDVADPFKDVFEKNDKLKKAVQVDTPFNTIDTVEAFSSIDPSGADVDFYRFKLEEGKTVVAEVLRSQADTVLGLFQCDVDDDSDSDSGSDSGSDSDSDSDSDKKLKKCKKDAPLVAFNDDFNGLLSRIQYTAPATGVYALATTFCCDFDFDGEDPGQGAPFDLGRYVLDVQVFDGIPISLGDDDTANIGFGFDFPFQGSTYNDVWVNSNGNLTFGSADTFFLPFVADFLFFQPRVSPLWEDLNPSAGGVVLYKEGADCLKVTFQDVPEFPASGANTFSATFDDAGNVQFDYAGLTETGGLTGITEGNGAADPGESDVGGGTFATAGTTYEFFSDVGDNDLSGSTVVFGSATSCD